MIKRKALANRLVAIIEGITVANGYKTDVAEVRHWSVDEVKQKSNQIYAEVRDVNARVDEGSRHYLTYEIMFAYSGPDVYDKLTAVTDDFYKALYANYPDLLSTFNKLDIEQVYENLEIDTEDRVLGVNTITIDFLHAEHANWIYDSTDYT